MRGGAGAAYTFVVVALCFCEVLFTKIEMCGSSETIDSFLGETADWKGIIEMDCIDEFVDVGE